MVAAALHIATPDDLAVLDGLVADFHGELNISTGAETRHAALSTLCQGTPHGVAYLIGPKRAPLGYMVISFGFSVELGGIDALLDEFYLRPAVRGRGMGGDALRGLTRALGDHGICAMHLEVDQSQQSLCEYYGKLGFAPRPYGLMTKEISREPI